MNSANRRNGKESEFLEFARVGFDHDLVHPRVEVSALVNPYSLEPHQELSGKSWQTTQSWCFLVHSAPKLFVSQVRPVQTLRALARRSVERLAGSI
jgi:hypothetical protein